MTLDRPLRIALAFAVVLGLLLALVALLLLTESVLEVWQRLRETSPMLLAGYLAVLAVLALLAAWAVLRLLFPRKPPVKDDESVLDEASLRREVDEAQARGMDVSGVEKELERLTRLRASGEVRIAVFGEISTGKSALIRALLPGDGDQSIAVSARGGTTRQVTDYSWTSPAGDRLVLVDVPGLNEAGGRLEQVARDEALRSHAVVFVCDDDLTRREFGTVQALRELHKPLVLALNKADRYDAAELVQVRERLRERAGRLADQGGDVEVVAISAAPVEHVVRVHADGREEPATRELPARVDELREAIQGVVDRDGSLMEELRDAAVFVLVERRLDAARSAYRAEQAERLVAGYTRKAVIGALAAVAPGTDVLIQGYLGANMVRELCELYQVPARDIDVKRFLQLGQDQVGRAMPVVMAIAGNGLKAFPGVGTIAGGLLHAVAYGLIFDALGRTLTATLRDSGRLRPALAADRLRKTLHENLERRTVDIAKLALAARRETTAVDER